MRSLVMSIFLYACETWAITADIERRIQALEIRCFCKLLPIWYRDHKSNKKVKARIGNAIGPYQDPLTFNEKTQTEVARSSELAKTILRGTDRGKDGKTTSKSGLALDGISYHGKLSATRSGES